MAKQDKVKIVYTFHPDEAKQGTEAEVSAEWARTLVRHGRARYLDAAKRNGKATAAAEAHSASEAAPVPLVEETSGTTRRRAAGGDTAADR